MANYSVKLPDVGEGIAEAEIVEWHVAVGDAVREDDVVVEVMTDKATVELPSPVTGVVTWLGASIGEMLPVGAVLLRIDLRSELPVATDPSNPSNPTNPTTAISTAALRAAPERSEIGPPAGRAGDERRAGGPLAAPAVRDRARTLGVDLDTILGSGPEGRVLHGDLDRCLIDRRLGDPRPPAPGRPAALPSPQTPLLPPHDVETITIVGLRRHIAERMKLAKERIPHFTYVEEVDVTEVERLRGELNRQIAGSAPDGPDGPNQRLTLLPMLMRAVVMAVATHPQMNARYDDNAGVVERHRAVHLGIATQTPRGLMVPVVRNAQERDLWDCGAEVARLSEEARKAKIKIEDLIGSTITISSLGALGGISSTPIINYPEVAIVGVNKIAERPVYSNGTLTARKMMNLSSSFDHRLIDGVDAAAFVQTLRNLLETPALLFIAR